MKVSVLMATYNRAELMERAIKSFLTQDYELCNLIILNNGSTDKTRIILNKYAEHPGITIHHVKENILPPANYNWLWDKADGELICQLHDDDELTKDSISLRVKKFKDNPSLQVVYGGYLVHNINGEDVYERKAIPPDKNLIFEKEYINFVTMMYRRNLPIRFDTDLVFYCDWLFKIRCLNEYNVSYVAEPVIKYTVHRGQESNRCKREERGIVEEKLMRDKLLLSGYESN
jgi:glycosyltransferase involved in cell wall biosynthesis